jgi:hypothetical protein
MQILRARQGFREKLKKIQSTWSHGVTDDQSAALVCSAALFEELTNDLPGALEILEHMFSSVLPGYLLISMISILGFTYYFPYEFLLKACIHCISEFGLL